MAGLSKWCAASRECATGSRRLRCKSGYNRNRNGYRPVGDQGHPLRTLIAESVSKEARKKIDQVSPSRIVALGPGQPPAHGGIVHPQMFGQIAQPIPIAPIRRGDLPIQGTPAAQELRQGRPPPLRLRAWNLRQHAVRLVRRHKVFASQIDLPPELRPGARALNPLLHKGPVAGLRGPLPLPKLRQNPAHREKRWGRFRPHRRLVAAPGPVLGMAHALGPHRIQHHIATQLQEMRVFLHQDGLEPSLEQMAHPPMPSIKGLGVHAIELTHAPGQIRLRGFQQKMVVVVHQAIGMAEPAEASHRLGQDRQPGLAIRVIARDPLAGVAPTGNMVDGVGKLKSQGTGHGEAAYMRQMSYCKT